MKLLTAILIIVLAALSCKQTGKAKTIDTISEKDAVTITNYVAGKKLFASNCETCHSLDKHAAPQMLIGIEDRWKDKALLYAFIRNSQAVMAKYGYANQIYGPYGSIAMPSFINLTDKQIEQMLLYVNVTLQ
jgi:mono/diheme cytochrome c family protein